MNEYVTNYQIKGDAEVLKSLAGILANGYKNSETKHAVDVLFGQAGIPFKGENGFVWVDSFEDWGSSILLYLVSNGGPRHDLLRAINKHFRDSLQITYTCECLAEDYYTTNREDCKSMVYVHFEHEGRQDECYYGSHEDFFRGMSDYFGYDIKSKFAVESLNQFLQSVNAGFIRAMYCKYEDVKFTNEGNEKADKEDE